MADAKKDSKIPDGIPPANAMARNFSAYKGKYMAFPEVTFDTPIENDKGDRFFASEKAGFRGFVLQFCPELRDKMRKYSVILDKIGTEWEVMGEIDEVLTWWNSYVFIKLRAIRVKDKFAAFFSKNDGEIKVEFVEKELIIQELERLEAAASEGIPEGLTEIPAGSDPVFIGKLYYHLSIAEDNNDLWKQLFTKSNQGRDAMMRSLYNGVRKNERIYFHVSTDIDKDNKKKYFFQMKVDGEYTGIPKPMTLIKDTDSEWRIDSASV